MKLAKHKKKINCAILDMCAIKKFVRHQQASKTFNQPTINQH
jgi:hypothetical protein